MRYVEDIYVQIFPGASRDVSLAAMCRRDQICDFSSLSLAGGASCSSCKTLVEDAQRLTISNATDNSLAVVVMQVWLLQYS